jgi:hypothetical protein
MAVVQNTERDGRTRLAGCGEAFEADKLYGFSATRWLRSDTCDFHHPATAFLASLRPPRGGRQAGRDHRGPSALQQARGSICRAGLHRMRRWERLCSVIVPQHLDDVLCQVLLEFPMPRHRLRDARIRIPIPIVFRPVSNQHATQPLDYLQQVCSFHGTTSSSTLRMPGIAPRVMSPYRSRRCSLSSSRVSPCVQ